MDKNNHTIFDELIGRVHVLAPNQLQQITDECVIKPIHKQQQSIDINGLITEYLPDSMVKGIHKFKGNDYSGSITIKHLLSHASGLPDWLEG